jgi:hypothetical protein
LDRTFRRCPRGHGRRDEAALPDFPKVGGVIAAIANAIHHATGKRIPNLPITLDKLL